MRYWSTAIVKLLYSSICYSPTVSPGVPNVSETCPAGKFLGTDATTEATLFLPRHSRDKRSPYIRPYQYMNTFRTKYPKHNIPNQSWVVVSYIIGSVNHCLVQLATTTAVSAAEGVNVDSSVSRQRDHPHGSTYSLTAVARADLSLFRRFERCWCSRRILQDGVCVVKVQTATLIRRTLDSISSIEVVAVQDVAFRSALRQDCCVCIHLI